MQDHGTDIAIDAIVQRKSHSIHSYYCFSATAFRLVPLSWFPAGFTRLLAGQHISLIWFRLVSLVVCFTLVPLCCFPVGSAPLVS